MTTIAEINKDILEAKKMVTEVELCIGKCEEQTVLTNKLIDTENLLTYCLSRLENTILLPCKVGDTVYTNTAMQGWYMRKKDRPYAAKIVFIGINGVDNIMNVVFENDNMLSFPFSQLGKSVFFTREEAEQALKERSDNNDNCKN